MADLGLYFGDEEDEEQLTQEDKALSYLVLSNEQDDAFDPVETEDLLAQLSTDSLISHTVGLDEDTDVVRLLAEPNLSAVEKVQLLAQSDHDFHRSLAAREMLMLMQQMRTQQAISHLIPLICHLSLDPADSVRESLASQIDKISLYFYCNSIIDNNSRKPLALDDFSEDYEDNELPEDDDLKSDPPPPLPHDILTPVFLNLLLDQNAGIAHQARLAIDTVTQNIPDDVLESEILNGVIAGLEKLYTPEGSGDHEQEDYDRFNKCGQDPHFSNKDDQDGEAELGKMLVVVLLTAMAPLLGPERCTRIVVPKLEMFTNNSQFFVRKEIVMALGALCKVVDQDIVVNKLLPMYDIFVQDDTWHIRRACCTILASFVGSLPVDMKATKVEEIYNIFSVDVSRSVRNSIMEVLGEVIAGFERNMVPDSLLEHFLNMGKQPVNEHERAVMCAFSFPAVVLTAGPSKWELMKPIYMRLAGTFRSPIRRSLACSLHEIARILGPELADRDLAVAFADCLSAEDEVKEGILGHVVEFISCLSPECRSGALNDIRRAWADLERSSNWRLRDSLVGQLSALCEIADGDDLLQVLLPLSVKACTDGVSTIRESAVMAFPALWDASERVGAVKKPRARVCSASGLDFMPLCESEDDTEGDKPLRDSRALFDQSDAEDTEMEEITESTTDSEEQSSLERSSETEDSPRPQPLAQPTTTIKEQVISQVADFAINGGFRSRVVAVQIIQSLLDHGIPTHEFEEHFLSVLVDHLANDAVANVRIWVARVVSWIIESEYYGDAVDSPRLSETLTKLQQDPDRDVRIYSGGPAELPKKTKKTKKAKAKKAKKNGALAKKEGDNTSTIKLTTTTISIFHQNPKSGEPAVMGEEQVNIAVDQIMVEGERREVHIEENDDDDDDDDDNDEDDDDDDDDDDSDDDSDDDDDEERKESEDVDVASEDQAIHDTFSQSKESVEHDNDSGIFVPGEVEEEEVIDLSEDSTPSTHIKSPMSVADTAVESIHDNQIKCDIEDKMDQDEQKEEEVEAKMEVEVEGEEEEEEEGEEEGITERVIPYTTLTSSGASPLDVEMNDSSEEEDSVEMKDEEEGIVEHVVPYTALTSNGASPLDVEMEDSPKEESIETKDSSEGEESAEMKDSSKEEESVETKGSSKKEESVEGEPAKSESAKSESSKSESAEKTDQTQGSGEESNVTLHTELELDEPSTTAFPPLCPSSPSPTILRYPSTPKLLSYAASVKNGDDFKAKMHLSNPHTMTSFMQANIPEPPIPSAATRKAAIADAQIRKAVNVKLSAAFGKQVSAINSNNKGNNKSDTNGKSREPLFAESSFPSISASSTLSLSNMTSPSSSRVPSSASLPSSRLPFSYASVVASGAAAAARAFRPPLPSPISAASTAVTF